MLTHRLALIVHCFSSCAYLVRSCQDKQVFHGVSRFVTDEDYEEITVRLGHYVELKCCSSSFTKIKWYKEEGKRWDPIQPVPAHFNPLAPTFSEEGQVLVIKSASESDEGNYKCVLEKDGRDVDKRMMSLTVAECDELARGPYAIAPIPCDITTVTLGGAIMLPCNGYFGCGNDDMRTVTWLVTESRGAAHWREASDVSDRYSINYFKRNGNSELGANLTINNIQQEDFNRKFMCLLSTPQVIDGESKLVVRLQNTQRPIRDTKANSSSMNIIFMSVACAVLVVVLILLVIVSCIHRKRNVNKNTQHSPNKNTQRLQHPEKEHMFTSAKIPSCSDVFDV